MLPELRGWGGDWSALGSDRGAADSGQTSWAPGAGTSGGHIGGLLQLCPLATLEVCNFGPLLAAGRRETPRPGSEHQDQYHRAPLEAVDQPDPQRLGRRLPTSTVVFMHLSSALRMMIGHTRLASLVRAREGTAGAAECAGDGGDRGREERQKGGGVSGSDQGGGIVGQGTCSWQYACIEEEVSLSRTLSLLSVVDGLSGAEAKACQASSPKFLLALPIISAEPLDQPHPWLVINSSSSSRSSCLLALARFAGGSGASAPGSAGRSGP